MRVILIERVRSYVGFGRPGNEGMTVKREPPWNLDFNSITTKAYGALEAADVALIGTPDYVGIAYFWGWEYRRQMRDCSFSQRRRVHTAFIKAGLDTDGVSPAHGDIISRLIEADPRSRGENEARTRRELGEDRRELGERL